MNFNNYLIAGTFHFLRWLRPIFYQGKIRDLTSSDLYDTLSSDISEQLGSRLEK
jgi:hypothetical protein